MDDPLSTTTAPSFLMESWYKIEFTFWSKTCHDIKNEISLSMFWSIFTLEDFFEKSVLPSKNRFCICYSFGLIKQYYYLFSFQSNSFIEKFLLNKDTLRYLLILNWNFWCTEVNDLALLYFLIHDFTTILRKCGHFVKRKKVGVSFATTWIVCFRIHYCVMPKKVFWQWRISIWDPNGRAPKLLSNS